jgi:hypothetical protein
MRRPFVISTGILALALMPAAVFAQAQPAQPPAGQPPAPAAQPPAQEKPAEKPPAIAFTGAAGMLLVQVKPDQTATFEELITKLKAALAATSDAALKAQGAGLKVYKSAEGMAGNALYVFVADPATPNVEYYPLSLLAKLMTDEEKRAPGVADMFKKYAEAVAMANKVNLGQVGGM